MHRFPTPPPLYPLPTAISDTDLNSSQVDGLEEVLTPIVQDDQPSVAVDGNGADAEALDVLGTSFLPMGYADPTSVFQGVVAHIGKG